MAQARRVQVEEARRKVQAGEALFVCAYDDEEKCKGMRLEGARTLGEFTAQMAGVAKDQEVIFYCA